MGNNVVNSFAVDITREYDKVFEELLKAYYKVVLLVDLTRGIDKKYVQGFEVRCYRESAVKQFVSTTTGEVLFEVRIDKLTNCIWWHTYWDK
jgi:hypothetical protein